MCSEDELSILIQLIVEKGDYRTGEFEMDAAVKFIDDKRLTLPQCVHDVTGESGYLFCSRRIIEQTGYCMSFVIRVSLRESSTFCIAFMAMTSSDGPIC
jgi:hypothetical protein